jgi:AbiU2
LGFGNKKATSAEMSEVIDRQRLAAYLAKKAQWLSWYETGAGESNSLQDQWFSMLLSEMSFRVAQEEVTKEPSSPLNIPLVAHLLSTGYFSSQVLATRRMFDGRKDVVSLRRLINDIRDNKELITREVYVSFDGTPYDPALRQLEAPGLQPADSPFSEWNRSRVRQERFDKLSKVNPEHRSREDQIDDSIFSKIDTWIDSCGATKLITLSHKYLAHAAEQSSIGSAIPTGVAFAEVEAIQKVVVQSMRAIYDILLSSGIYSEVTPMVPLGFFGKVWDGDKLIASTARMNKHWDEMAQERNQWVKNLDDEFFV